MTNERFYKTLCICLLLIMLAQRLEEYRFAHTVATMLRDCERQAHADRFLAPTFIDCLERYGYVLRRR